jgi:hypothetical protein
MPRVVVGPFSDIVLQYRTDLVPLPDEVILATLNSLSYVFLVTNNRLTGGYF